MDVKIPTAAQWHRFTRAQIEKARPAKNVSQTSGSGEDHERNAILMCPGSPRSGSITGGQRTDRLPDGDEERTTE